MSAQTSEITGRSASAMREEGLDRLKAQLRRELGPVICAALDEPTTTEVIVNSDGTIWVERFGRGMEKEEATLTPAQAMRVMTTTAALLKTVVNAQQPIVEGLLPLDGSRFAGSVPPISLNASFNIRKKPARIFTLEEYVAHGTLTAAQMAAMHQAIDAKLNILVVGGTGSGKTTLLNAILDAVAKRAPLERVVMIQDTDEIQCRAANVESFISTRDFDMTYLLRHTMRRSPLRIVVGEVRGPEAHVLVKAWGTGHPGGASTVHADSAEDGMTRIEDLIEEDPGKLAKPWSIAKAINVLVYIEKESSGLRRRIVRSVLKVSGYDRQNGKYLFDLM